MARIIQAQANNRPVGYLILELVVSGFIIRALPAAPRFHASMAKALKQHTELVGALMQTGIAGLVVLEGLHPLVMKPEFQDLGPALLKDWTEPRFLMHETGAFDTGSSAAARLAAAVVAAAVAVVVAEAAGAGTDYRSVCRQKNRFFIPPPAIFKRTASGAFRTSGLMTQDTIIVGAGPAGLYAAYLLAKQGRKCLLLEARARIGGRARSIRTEHAKMIETGAEFIHGKLPLSLALVQEAGLPYTVVGGSWVSVRGGMAEPDSEGPQWASFMRALGELDQDMTLQAFLDTHFTDDAYAALRDRAIAFAEGYDSADAARVSAKALFEEWSAEESEQYRIDDGYSALMDYLAVQIRAAGSRIWINKEVTRIDATENSISVITANEELCANQVIVAVPLGVLQSGRLEIVPATHELQQCFSQMGFGDVIKFVLVFREAFWETHFPGLGFLMSGADVPTWWTQSPRQSNVFTGWLAGKTAKIRSGLSTEMLRQMALNSLAILFSKPVEVLEAELLELHVFNWSGDRLTGGAYAYETPEAANARESLRELAPAGVSFIGEYEYAGPSMGTVEAAFRSAKQQIDGGQS